MDDDGVEEARDALLEATVDGLLQAMEATKSMGALASATLKALAAKGIFSVADVEGIVAEAERMASSPQPDEQIGALQKLLQSQVISLRMARELLRPTPTPPGKNK